MRADPEKVDTITSWPRPKNIKELQTFLGFANFYRRFIADYAKVTIPLTELLKKGPTFQWTDDAEQAFQKLKALFSSAPMMRHYDPDKEIWVETDASDFGLCGIVTQLFEDGIWHPIAFASRKMQPAERNYETYDQELLAIVFSFKTWRHYFEGSKHTVQIYTDHNNLRGISAVQRLNPRQARWATFLGSFDFQIHHRPGKTNPADGPSRRPDYYTENAAINTLLPTLRRKLQLAKTERINLVREASRGTGSANEEISSSAPAIQVARQRDAASPSRIAGVTGCIQYIPRCEARILLASETQEGEATPLHVVLAELQRKDSFANERRELAAQVEIVVIVGSRDAAAAGVARQPVEHATDRAGLDNVVGTKQPDVFAAR